MIGILAAGIVATTSQTAVYTAPKGANHVRITLFTLKNVDVAAQNPTAYSRVSGQATPIHIGTYTLPTDWMKRVFGGKDGEVQLGPGDSLEVSTNTANALHFVVKGEEVFA